jgi:hypothetical protein
MHEVCSLELRTFEFFVTFNSSAFFQLYDLSCAIFLSSSYLREDESGIMQPETCGYALEESQDPRDVLDVYSPKKVSAKKRKNSGLSKFYEEMIRNK